MNKGIVLSPPIDLYFCCNTMYELQQRIASFLLGEAQSASPSERITLEYYAMLISYARILPSDRSSSP